MLLTELRQWYSAYFLIKSPFKNKNIYCILFVQLHRALTEHNTPIRKRCLGLWSLKVIVIDQSRNRKQLLSCILYVTAGFRRFS